jgi:hypothetical protein
MVTTSPARRLPLWIAIALLCAAASLLPRRAEAQALDASAPFSRSGSRAPVPDDLLAGVRGGFESPDGTLQLSIGVQRQVLVDGQAVAVSTLQFCGPSCATGDAGSALAWVQRGAGNSAAGLAAAGQGLVVQNTLDQQRLTALTTIDIKTNGLQIYQGAALQSALGSALAASTRR